MYFPPKNNAVPNNFRAIYVVGDPREAVLSVFRRNYQHWHIQHMDGEISKWNFDWDLDEFLSQQKDYFKYERHFENWKNAKRKYPILIVKFDSIWENLEELIDFAGLPKQVINKFPARKERSIKWKEVNIETKNDIEFLYGKLAMKIQSMPSFQIIEPTF